MQLHLDSKRNIIFLLEIQIRSFEEKQREEERLKN